MTACVCCRYADGVLSSSAHGTAAGAATQAVFETEVVIERIAILGLPGGLSGWQASPAFTFDNSCCADYCLFGIHTGTARRHVWLERASPEFHFDVSDAECAAYERIPAGILALFPLQC